MKQRLIRLSVAVLIYLLLQYLIPFGKLVIYPVVLFVVYLHEIGHAIFAVLTGGSVHGIQVSADTSGHTLIDGGWWPLVLSGGYIGSAVLGNIILYVSLVRERWNSYMAVVFMVGMALTGIFLFQSLETTVILFLFAGVLFVFIRYLPAYLSNVNLFIGTVSVCYILQDFAGGPASDLQRFAAHIPFIPVIVWAFVWLGIAGYITYYNIRYWILRS